MQIKIIDTENLPFRQWSTVVEHSRLPRTDVNQRHCLVSEIPQQKQISIVGVQVRIIFLSETDSIQSLLSRMFHNFKVTELQFYFLIHAEKCLQPFQVCPLALNVILNLFSRQELTIYLWCIPDYLSYNNQSILTKELSKKINPDLFLRQFLICPVCGHALTGAVSRGNGGRYAYYNCCEEAKHIRARAEKVNEGFAKYVGSLKPNETVLNLYEQILNDVRKEQSANVNETIAQLQNKMLVFQKRIQTAKDKYLDGEMSKAEKDEAVSHNQKEVDLLQEKIDILKEGNRSKIKPKLEYSMSLINNIDKFILDAPVETKIKLISSMFPEKIEFDGEKYRTNSYNKVLDLIFQQTNELRGDKKEKGERFSSFSNSVPRPGVEPGWK